MWPFDSYPVLEKVIVNLKTGAAFRGVIWQKRGSYLVLRNVELLKPGGETVPMDGEIAVDRANVDFLQVV